MRITVQLGDTLGGIAERFGTTVEEILRLNPDITDPNAIFEGQIIEVPEPGGSLPSEEVEPATFIAGLDRLDYPGDDVMTFLWDNTNLFWTGFYLAPAPSQQNTSWMDRREFLKELGWGFAPIYVGQQTPQSSPGSSHILTAEQGRIDAQEAAALATQAGFPPATVIYLDIEQGPPPVSETIEYYQAWVDEMALRTIHMPGVYCSFLQVADALREADSRPRFWVFQLQFSCDPDFADEQGLDLLETPTNEFPRPDPASSGIGFATMLQYCQDLGATPCSVAVNGEVIPSWDFNSAVTSDPSTYLRQLIDTLRSQIGAPYLVGLEEYMDTSALLPDDLHRGPNDPDVGTTDPANGPIGAGSSGIFNWARRKIGLPPIGETSAYAGFLFAEPGSQVQPFDLNKVYPVGTLLVNRDVRFVNGVEAANFSHMAIVSTPPDENGDQKVIQSDHVGNPDDFPFGTYLNSPDARGVPSGVNEARTIRETIDLILSESNPPAFELAGPMPDVGTNGPMPE